MTDTLWAHLARAVEALSPLLLAALSWLSLQVAAFIKTRVQNDRLRGVLERVDDAVLVAVREIEQVYVSRLKNASADGELTADERKDAKDAAVTAARSYLGVRGLVELGKVLGISIDDVDRVVSARVEAAVYNLRAQPTRMLGSVLRSALHRAAPDKNQTQAQNGAH
ncbi:MAG TPA: hypothetical protein VHP33_17535 [Polyangiaceae bacterium]|nr:hypothetical protein [Polyangiaceae bacterium]